MDRPVLSPSKTSETPPEKTLKLLHERLNLAEEEAKKLSEQLTEYGFNPRAGVQSEAAGRSVIETITPFEAKPVDEVQYQVLKKNYEQLVSRVCRAESTVQSLKLALVSLEAENSLMNKDSVAGTISANEAYEKKLMKLKKELVTSRRQLDESERFRAHTEQDFQKVREQLGVKSGSSNDVVEKVQELRATREKLTKRVNELREELNHEKSVRLSLEGSHKDLLDRVTEMEQIVERENADMKLLSGDCAKLKQELSQTKAHYDREYQTRMQMEKQVERLNNDLEDMESKLLNISNERKGLDLDLIRFKRENKELKQQLGSLQNSNETLKEVNLDLEQRYKEASNLLRVTVEDNKILIAQHRESVEKERLAFAEKLKEQDMLLDEAKQSILQELTRERQAGLEKEKENAKFKNELASLQKLLHEKDVDVSRLKNILENLALERDNMMQENDKAILEIKRELDKFVSEKISLEAQVDQRKEESKTTRERNERLEEECQKLRTRLIELEHQQSNQHRVNTALQEMMEDKRRLAYEKGFLQSQVEKLDLEVASLSQIKAENVKLKRTVAAFEKKFSETEKELQDCRYKLRDTETSIRKLHSVAADKENEVKILTRNKDEAFKETERVLRQMEINEGKYSKKIDSLQRALILSKEDNKKLASTLETIIASHSQLQASFESLQTELGKRDSESKHTQEERSKTQSRIWELQREVESLQNQVIEMQESDGVEHLQRALQLLEEDRDKLVNTVEPLMKTNKELQESLETLAKEVSRKEAEIKKLRQASLLERKEMKTESEAKENKLDEVLKRTEKEIKEIKMKHKKEVTKLRNELRDMGNLKNTLKEQNITLKREQQELEDRHRKLKEKLKTTKKQMEHCLEVQTTQEKEVEVARQKIDAMSRELAALENLKSEYTKNNMEQAHSLQEFVSELTDLQEEFRRLSEAQRETDILCRQKDEEISKEKLRRKEIEVFCYKLKNREKHLHEMREDTERKLEEANFESQQVAANLQEAHEWFKDKFTNLQTELNKSRKVQSVLQKDNVEQYKALQEERRRAEEATEKAKEIVKSSRMMISRLVGQVAEPSDESKEIQEAMALERIRSVYKIPTTKETSAKGRSFRLSGYSLQQSKARK